MNGIVLLSVFVLSIVGGQALTDSDVDNCINNCASTMMFTKYCGLVNAKHRTLDEDDLDCLSFCRISYKVIYPGPCAEDKLRLTYPLYREPCHHCMVDLDFDGLCPNIHNPNIKVISKSNVDCKAVCELPDTHINIYKFVKLICADRSLSP